MKKKKQDVEDLCESQHLDKKAIDPDAELEFYPSTGWWAIGATEEEPLDWSESDKEKK